MIVPMPRRGLVAIGADRFSVTSGTPGGAGKSAAV
jgi:hypothetical protein